MQVPYLYVFDSLHCCSFLFPIHRHTLNKHPNLPIPNPFQTSSNTFYKIFFTFQILNFLFQTTQNLYFYLNFGTPNATLFFSQCLCRFYPYVSPLNFEADEKTQPPSYKFQPNFYFLLFAETHSHVPLNVT